MLSFLSGMLGSFGTIAVGIYLVTKGEIDYGTIMAIVTLQLSICGTLQRFGGAVAGLTGLLSCAQRVVEFLQLEEENWPVKEAQIKPDMASNGIDIEQLSFAYDTGVNGNNGVVLENLNLHVAPGERIMLVGHSGCGKSTLLKLLMGFYQKTAGTIRILGHDIEEYSLEQLRDLITYVPQESYLFEGTIEENIRYGKMDATKEQIVVAAELAYANTFIEGFSDGYETKLTAGGHNLSGGQRQRIAIARAFLKNAPIILLDEPSSALDVESEGMINLAMKELMKEKIVLMVTHRTNSFKDFDRMVQI
jgi:ABC-type multidrug transport system fused ATPase/permease subunit